MTRIDVAMIMQDDYDEIAAKLISENCPGDLLDWGEPVIDEKTVVFDINGYIAGCRGITCKKCWNQEVANGQA